MIRVKWLDYCGRLVGGLLICGVLFGESPFGSFSVGGLWVGARNGPFVTSPRGAVAQESSSTADAKDDGGDADEPERTIANTLVASDGRRVPAKLLGGEWPAKLQFDVGGKEQDWKPGDLVRWGVPREAVRGHGVLLGGASLVIVDQWELDDTRFTVPLGAASVATEMSLPRTSVRGVVLSWPAEPAQRERLVRRLAESRGAQDQILLENGDTLTGMIERTVRVPRGRAAGLTPAAPRPVGAAADGDDATRANSGDDLEPGVSIKTLAGTLSVSFDRVAAIAFRGLPTSAEPFVGPHVLLGFADGSLLDVKSARRDGERFTVTLADDTTFESDPQWLWGDAVFVQPLGAGVVYLSDLPELGYKHVPLLDREWSFGRDRNVSGLRPRNGGAAWIKGIGMHSTSRLAYELNGGYASLQAELAIDDAADRHGSVVFRVYVDRGEGTWQNAYESPIVRHGDATRAIQVDLRGVLRMALIVDAADWGDVGDHANWLDARLVRSREKNGR